jgi:anti-anti-sigma factor
VRTRDMRAMPASMPSVLVGDLPFTLNITRQGSHRVVQIGGELDLATRNLARRACLSGRRETVVVDMADMTFMDCCGYGGLVAARRVLQRHGGSLTLHNPAGQPAELLMMLALLEGTD